MFFALPSLMSHVSLREYISRVYHFLPSIPILKFITWNTQITESNIFLRQTFIDCIFVSLHNSYAETSFLNMMVFGGV